MARNLVGREAAAALAPTAASAAPWHGHHHWHHGWYGGYGFYGPTIVAAPDCYVVRKVVDTPCGKQMRRVTVCD